MKQEERIGIGGSKQMVSTSLYTEKTFSDSELKSIDSITECVTGDSQKRSTSYFCELHRKTKEIKKKREEVACVKGGVDSRDIFMSPISCSLLVIKIIPPQMTFVTETEFFGPLERHKGSRFSEVFHIKGLPKCAPQTIITDEIGDIYLEIEEAIKNHLYKLTYPLFALSSWWNDIGSEENISARVEPNFKKEELCSLQTQELLFSKSLVSAGMIPAKYAKKKDEGTLIIQMSVSSAVLTKDGRYLNHGLFGHALTPITVIENTGRNNPYDREEKGDYFVDEKSMERMNAGFLNVMRKVIEVVFASSEWGDNCAILTHRTISRVPLSRSYYLQYEQFQASTRSTHAKSMYIENTDKLGLDVYENTIRNITPMDLIKFISDDEALSRSILEINSDIVDPKLSKEEEKEESEPNTERLTKKYEAEKEYRKETLKLQIRKNVKKE